MINFRRADPFEHELTVVQVCKRVMAAVELQSTHAVVLRLHNHIVRCFRFLCGHVIHTSYITYNTEQNNHIIEQEKT